MAVMMFYEYPLVQISLLIALQILDLIRFIATKPYQSKIRNVVGVLLEIILLAFFALNLAMYLVINKIQTSTDLALNSTLG